MAAALMRAGARRRIARVSGATATAGTVRRTSSGYPPPMGAAEPDCLFCKIVAGEIPSTRVAEDERTVTFMDINPATRGHVLVVPRTHARDLLEIDDEDL